MVVRNLKTIWLALALCLGATSAFAQEESLDSSFTLFGSMRTGGEFSEIDSDITFDASDSSAYGLIWNTRHKHSAIASQILFEFLTTMWHTVPSASR